MDQVLRGVTWDHTRGWGPVALTGQVFADHHPGTWINWERQSLWDFGEGSTEDLARTYDLVVVDHPMTATLAESGWFLPFEDDDAVPTVGGSAGTYLWAGRRWALALDAACQVSVWRADLLSGAGEAVPRTWEEVLGLATRTGRVVMPMTPIDVFSSWLTLCAGFGAPVGSAADGRFLDRDAARLALDLLRQIHDVVPSLCLSRNPIATLESMAHANEAWYCPLTFGYSNYSRRGYVPICLDFGDIPATEGSAPAHGALLGGSGIAVSALGRAPELAAKYARWVTSGAVQSGEYVRGGGQPAATVAWDDADTNRMTQGFFHATRSTIDKASIRPAHPSYPRFQTSAADLVHRYLTRDHDPNRTIDDIELLYAQR